MSQAQQTADRPIRLVALRRRHDMDHASFCRHWRDVHAPLMAAAPGIKYVQNHVIAVIEPSNAPSSSPNVDGFAWIDVTPQPAAQTSIPQGAGNAAALDLRNFVGASSRMTCQVRIVVPVPRMNAAAKLISVITPQGKELSEIGRRDPFDDLLVAVAAIPGLVGCRQNTVTGLMPLTDPSIADACLNALTVFELWFEDTGVMRSAVMSSEWRRAQNVSAELGYAVTSYLVEELVIT